MSSTRRITVVSADAAFAKQLAAALAPVGAVDLRREPHDGLYVIHGELGELPERARVIAVVPRGSLAAIVDRMQQTDRVVGAIVAEDFDPRELAAMAARVLSGDLFGLDKVMAPPIQTRHVRNHDDKLQCLAALVTDVPRAYHEAIEQCADEMIMNALYDAPVDGRGKRVFAGASAKARVALSIEQTVVVQYASDGNRFAIATRDAFGSLERATVLRVLHKCLHAAQPVDRRMGGAGLGLYLMVSSATAVYFHVVPGKATEVVCVFDFRSKQLAELGFIVGDVAPALPMRPANLRVTRKRSPAERAVRRGILLGLVAAVAAGAAIALWPRSHGPITFTTVPAGATIAIDGRKVGASPVTVDLRFDRSYDVVARRDGFRPAHATLGAGDKALALDLTPVSTVALETDPPGAAVAIDGKPMGGTPIAVTSLAAGSTVAIAFDHVGYQPATARVTVPAPGASTRVVQRLEPAADVVRVHFDSTPPGARIVRADAPASASHTYTPADVFVEANKLQRFTLVMAKHVPAVIEPFTPGGPTEKSATLVDGAVLHVEATLDGRVTISGAPHCADVALPVDCTLAPGDYIVEYAGHDAKLARTVRMAAKDAAVKLELGLVRAAPGKLLQPGGLHEAAFEAGTREVTVSDAAGTHTATVQVTAGATVVAN